MILANYYQKEQAACKSFLLDVVSAKEKISTGKSLAMSTLQILGFAAMGYFYTHRLIRNIRRIVDACDAECADIKCLDLFYGTAKGIRDNYAGIHAAISRHKPLYLLLNPLIERSLDDWDELVTDCVIGSDPEFKSMILQIAEKI